jgi:hypothetical protein
MGFMNIEMILGLIAVILCTGTILFMLVWHGRTREICFKKHVVFVNARQLSNWLTGTAAIIFFIGWAFGAALFLTDSRYLLS